MTTPLFDVTRDRDRQLRPVLRQLIGRAAYLEERLPDFGKLCGLANRTHPKWGPHIAAELLAYASTTCGLSAAPVACHIADSFLTELRNVDSMYGNSSRSVAQRTILLHFLQFRASQLGSIWRILTEYVPEDTLLNLRFYEIVDPSYFPSDKLRHYYRFATAA